MINIQKNKETIKDIWKGSKYEDITKLQSNNVGCVGETFIQTICEKINIKSNIDGIKEKKIGGGNGDGVILGKSVEIKTAHMGSSNSSFQHELGENPWNADYMIFVDISPENIYMTIFKNFDEKFYKSKDKCKPYFPTKCITWRKNKGSFKLDTTLKINESNISNGYTIKDNDDNDLQNIKDFILLNIK